MDGRPSGETAVEASRQASPSEKPALPGSNGVKTSDKKPGDENNVLVSTVGKDAFYDPSKESIWTRLGLTAESFKRAPGTTAGQTGQFCQISPKQRLSGPALVLITFFGMNDSARTRRIR